MINIIGRRKLWYSISLTILVPSVIFLAIFGLKFGIDFTGGSVLEIKGSTSQAELGDAASQAGIEDITINSSGPDQWQLRYKIDEQAEETQQKLEGELGRAELEVVRFDQVGPSVSRDLIRNALLAIGLMSLAVVVYITWAFRTVPKEVGALKFGLATLVAAFAHDAMFVISVFAILGKTLGIEFDSYIVTAILTVIGFSIHDTVVVFDRVREKLSESARKLKLAEVVNQSVNETLVRSLNTSMVIVLVLLALLLFGGTSTKNFVLALLIGMVAGTYSSIFIASPLLVSWNKPKASQS